MLAHTMGHMRKWPLCCRMAREEKLPLKYQALWANDTISLSVSKRLEVTYLTFERAWYSSIQ